MTDTEHFPRAFCTLTGHKPFRWQTRLYEDWFARGRIPSACDIPTGLGKTSVMAVWLIALAQQAAEKHVTLPRRLVYVVDRRAVVDQASEEARRLAANAKAALGKDALGIDELPISTLRGQFVDNRRWLEDPSAPAIIVGTIDMIGSRLLFEGYGVSRGMRPYQAGLLGADSLIILDEAHLVPPFSYLLRSIEQDPSFWPKAEADRALVPRFRFLPLSATQRDADAQEDGGERFQLKPIDEADPVVGERLNAPKRLRIEPLAEKDHDKQLASTALALATRDERPSRVVVFCARRAKKDDGAGPSAEGVAEAIRELTQADKKSGRAATSIEEPELLVGARRVRERDQVAEKLKKLGFIGRQGPPLNPTFLVATAAGEVGVDIDADHMVCDLATWERMVQRLGRVNRGGGAGRVAEIVIFDTSLIEKDEVRKPCLDRTLALLEQLKGDASLNALRELYRRVDADAIAAASTPEPLRPALNRALVDAWSMTSLEAHPGRPEVGRWLRGWIAENQQTTLAWRTHLPIPINNQGRPIPPSKKEVESFFEACPPHQSEHLETETYRVVDWLQERSRILLKRKRRTSEDSAEDEPATIELSAAGESTSEEPQAGKGLPAARLERDDIVALALASNGAYADCYTARDLAQERKSKAKEDLKNEFNGKIVVVDARFGGLKDGLLSLTDEEPPQTVDTSDDWSKDAGFRVLRVLADNEPPDEGGKWRFEDDIVLRRNDEGVGLERLVVQHFKSSAQKEDARSIAKPQELSEHQAWARSEATRIAERLGLATAAVTALALGTGLHDEGKKAERWQRAFKAPRDAARDGLRGPLAKTRGPINQAILGGYRHEFGSLPYVEGDAAFRALQDDWHDLVLHLVASHHGYARPLIETRGCEDGPPELLEERACAVALRFARLQKRWGPWGLAWWEALLRAADQQASRDNDERSGVGTDIRQDVENA